MDPTSLVIAILVVTMLFMAGMVWLGHLDIVQAIARMDRSATAAEHAADRARLAAAVLILGIVWAPAQTLAQQTFTPLPPPVPVLPSIIPQTQAFTSCVLNCDTAVGLCQGACSVNNSPILTAAAAGAHEALTQCYLRCTSQQLACKQACPAPH